MNRTKSVSKSLFQFVLPLLLLGAAAVETQADAKEDQLGDWDYTTVVSLAINLLDASSKTRWYAEQAFDSDGRNPWREQAVWDLRRFEVDVKHFLVVLRNNPSGPAGSAAAFGDVRRSADLSRASVDYGRFEIRVLEEMDKSLSLLEQLRPFYL